MACDPTPEGLTSCRSSTRSPRLELPGGSLHFPGRAKRDRSSPFAFLQASSQIAFLVFYFLSWQLMLNNSFGTTAGAVWHDRLDHR